MARLLVITSYVQNFHNYRDGIDEQIYRILGQQFSVIEETQEFDALSYEDLRAFDCVMLFCAATWTVTGKDPFAVNLTKYLITGGRILLLHIVSLGKFTEGSQLFGGAFRMHPPYQAYTFVPSESGKAFMDGAESFTICDEAHLLFTERLLSKDVLLYAVNNDHRKYDNGVNPHQDIYAQSSGIHIPLSWRVRFCKGKMIYACPGHNAESFANEVYTGYLRNCAKWLLD